MSIYLKVKISPDSLNKYLTNKLPAPSNYSDWLDWLEDKEYCGAKFTQQTIEQIDYGICSRPIDYFNNWNEDEWIEENYQEYDQETNTWYAYMLTNTDNYHDIIRDISVLRGVFSYVDEADDSGFMLYYEHFWEKDCSTDTAISLKRDASTMLDHVPPEYYAEAREKLEIRKRKVFLEEFGFEDFDDLDLEDA